MRHRWVFVGAAAAALMGVFAAAVIITARPGSLAIFSGGGADPQCRAAARVAEAVAPHAKGQMAAFEAIAPVDVSALPYNGTGADAARIGALAGKVTLFNLWATWCAPCRAEMPSLAALHEAKAGPDFEVIAVSIDNRDKNRPEDFLAETGAQALAYHREPTMSLFNSLKNAGLLEGMPTTLLIAPDGCAAGVLGGAAEWDSPDAERLIDAATGAV